AEPRRGRMDGIESPPDPHPFRASLAVLGSVLPVFNWLWLAARKASARDWLANLATLAPGVVVVGVMTQFTSCLSPRPPLQLGGLGVNPHTLQWCVAGFGACVVLNLIYSLRLVDRPTFALITRSPSLLLCMAIGSLQMMINYGTMGFTPSFLMKSYGLSPSTTGLQFGLLSAAIGIIGPLIAGPQIGRASCRERGEISVVAVSLKRKRRK